MNFLGVFGHVVLDFIFRVPKLPDPNTTVPVKERRRYFGGTAGNIARGAARLGVRTALASFVGEDFPDDYHEALRSEGIDLTDLRKVPGNHTPTAWIFSAPEGDQVAIIDQGPMEDPSGLPVLNHTVESSELIHIGTGRPAYYRKVMELARRLGRRIAFDPSQEIHYVYAEEDFLHILRQSDIFFGNPHEFRKAFEFTGLKEPGELLEYVETVILTKGREGSVVYTGEAAWKIPCIPPARAGDVTGAGDAYRAGFYAGLQRDLDLAQCGLLGAAVASFCVEGGGPQDRLPYWEDALRRARDFQGKVKQVVKS